MAAGRRISIQEAAADLGVHYMTVYRYVRTGRLAAEKKGSQWWVDPADLAALAATSSWRGRPPATERPRSVRSRSRRLADRLVAGDEPGAWMIVEEALRAGAGPDDVLLEVLGPALTRIGDRWATGDLSVGDEHRASGVAQRLIGRLGPLARRRGSPVGTVVVGAPPGELHQIPIAMAADLLRAAAYDVVDLGADVPAAMFGEAARRAHRLVAVGVGVTGAGHEESVTRVVDAVARARPDTAMLAGGAAIAGPAHAGALGAQFSGHDGASLVRVVEAVRLGRSAPA